MSNEKVGSFGTNSKYLRGVIYIYTNKINGKVYVGQTYQKEEVRQAQHKNDAKNSKNYPFHNAINKYGWENFDYKALFRTSTRIVDTGNPNGDFKLAKKKLLVILDAEEKYYIKKYKATDPNFGYNICDGGSGGPAIGKEIAVFSLNGEFINRYGSISDAVLEIGGDVSSIVKCLKGKNNTSQGYVWRYLEDCTLDEEGAVLNIPRTLPKEISVVQLTKEGEFIEEFENTRKAVNKLFPELINERDIQIKMMSIAKVGRKSLVKGKLQRVAFGFLWMEREEYYELINSGGKIEPYTRSAPANSLRILKFDLEDNFLEEYESANSAARSLGIPESSVRNAGNSIALVCSGKPNKHGIIKDSVYGYKWKFKDN